MTIKQIDNDVYIASQLAFKASTPDLRLAGAEWLQQLASELVEAIKAEQPEPLADATDAQDGPGDGWRWLEPGEVIGECDMVVAGNGNFSITSIAGYKVAPGQYRCYRTKF